MVDTGYSNEYEKEFESLFEYFSANGTEGYADIINDLIFIYSEKGEYFFIADLIHFLKNRKTQIVFSQIKMKTL